MKKIFVFGAISLMLLAVILTGCKTAGQAIYVKTGETKEGGAGLYFQTGANIQGVPQNRGGGLQFNLKGIPSAVKIDGSGGIQSVGTICDKNGCIGGGFWEEGQVGEVAGQLGIYYDGAVQSNELISTSAVRTDNIFASNINANGIIANEITTGNRLEPFKITDDLWIQNGITLNELSGNGNAYTCINSDGMIFRSETPCR